MLSAAAEEALSTLTSALSERPELEEAVRNSWRRRVRGPKKAPLGFVLPEALQAASDLLSAELPTHTCTGIDGGPLSACFAGADGPVLLLWCDATTWRRDTALSGLLTLAAKQTGFEERVAAIAAERVVEGPLLDALACAPLLGAGAALRLAHNAQARARLEILVWEAGARALEVPAFGRWLWGSMETFEAMIREPARGALRGRVLAARCLEIGVCGLKPGADSELVGRALQVLQPLLLHPEPLVWVHAARALGRLTGQIEQLEGTLLDWVLGESQLLRQRALTAFASLPEARLKFLASQLTAILAEPEADWALAAVAAATPYLFFERRVIWDGLAARIIAGEGGAVAARALARGLAPLWRRGERLPEIEQPLRALRELAWCARPTSLDEARRWIEVTALTDAVDGAERDPLDVELGLENLMRVAAHFDDEEADARAARFASSLSATFIEAQRIALGDGRLRQRAAALNALEGCARAFALRLWSPMLATRPAGVPIDEPDLEETWRLVARAPAEILDSQKPPPRLPGAQQDEGLSLEVLAIRLGGYALDACGEDAELGPGRGPTAHDTCHWLRKVRGLFDGSRELPGPLKAALSALFWRLVDTTRGTALGEVDDLEWLGPFAAWWALVIDRPALLLQLATALPMLSEGALVRCCERAELLRTAVSSDTANGEWGAAAADALASLHAVDTELAHALTGLAGALCSFAPASGLKANLEALCLELVLAGERLQGALADPVRALHAANLHGNKGSLSHGATENTPRVAALVARAIRRALHAGRVVRFSRSGRLGASGRCGALGDPSHPAPTAPE